MYEKWVRDSERRQRNGEGRVAVFLKGCLCCVGSIKKESNSDDSDNNSESSTDATVAVQLFDGDDNEQKSIPRLSQQQGESKMDVAKLRPIEWFYREPFFQFVSHSVIKWILVAGFFALLVIGFYNASLLETPAQQEAWYPDTHLMQSFSENRQRFMSSDEDRVVPVDIYWGLRGMDVEGVDKYNPRERGELVLDDAFDASSEAAQTFLKQACSDVKLAQCDVEGCGGVGSYLVRNGADGEVTCPMDGFEVWLTANGGTFPYTDANTLESMLKEFVSSDLGSIYANHVGFDASDNLMFIRISMESTLVFPTVAKVSRPVFDTWEGYILELNSNAPPGVSNAKQTAYYTW